MIPTDSADMPSLSEEPEGGYIQVVEDDPHILRQIEFALRTNGYAVATAINGTDALRNMMHRPPRLLITDIMMPEMDGFELVAMVRRDEILAEVPVIMLTARAEDITVAQAYNSGTDLYLTKPFNPTELLQFVRRILD
ncbi:MAG: response regulator [Capsulimonadales bacterium]|nr:response regulator [Capsulimonadales bacterium]